MPPGSAAAALLAACVILAAPLSAAAGGLLPPCPDPLPGAGLLLVPSCVWERPVDDSGGGGVFSVTGSRDRDAQPAVATVVAAPGLQGDGGAKEDAGPPEGSRLDLQRLVLSGFDFAPAGGGGEPMLWPRGLVSRPAALLNLTDVRLVTASGDVFAGWLQFFRGDARVTYWTDNTTFLHVHEWNDKRTHMTAVGLLLSAPPQSPNPLRLQPPLVDNAVLSATNASLLPALLALAGRATPAPLLVYVTANASLAPPPALMSPNGIAIGRPVVLVGLRSLPTSVDFGMVVNQLNETGSDWSNVTFVGLVLENLAPGDSVTSGVAAPFSIAITNNVWAAYYNRSRPNDVRLTLVNATLVLPQESEMAYLTFMFTMFTSPLPYLRKQTIFYSDVLHVSQLQFQPGPGPRSITVSRLSSWYHFWSNVVLTTDPVVAAPLPLPPRPLSLATTTRASPLVQAVHTREELTASSEETVVGDRAHVLLVLANISLAGAPPQPVRLSGPMTWLGSSPADRAGEAWPELAAAHGGHPATPPANSSVGLAMGFRPGAVLLPAGSGGDSLQLQQLTLSQLPQGRGTPQMLADGGRASGGPPELWTVLLWSFERPMGERTLSLDGVTAQLPPSELGFIRGMAAQSPDFVVPLSGPTGSALTFQGVALRDDGAVHLSAFQGPGITATNLTLAPEDAGAARPSGYAWPLPDEPPAPSQAGGVAQWAVAVIVLCCAMAAALAAAGALLCWRRHQRQRRVCLRGECSHSKHALLPTAAGAPGKHGGSGSGCSGVPTADPRPCVPGGNKQASNAGNACAGDADSSCVLDSGVDFVPATGTAVAQLELAQQRQQQQQQAGKAGGATSVAGPAAAAAGAAAAAAAATAAAGASQATTDGLAGTVAAGMQRWRAAVSTTTMQLMERRMDAAAAPLRGGSSTSSTDPLSRRPGSGGAVATGLEADAEAAAVAGEPPAGTRDGSAASSAAAQQQQQQQQLQLLELLGQGSFGCVWLAMWRGKHVAVKVLQLPANALLEPPGEDGNLLAMPEQRGGVAAGEGGYEERQRRRRAQRLQQQKKNSPPHMAIMEAVLSSTMSHPNVVQVFTYMLNPLTSGTGGSSGSVSLHGGAPTAGDAALAGGGGKAGQQQQQQQQDIAGWELKLVMEYCDQGSLREALDCGLLAKAGGSLAPSAVLAIAHDVAAAMLHLHSEGIVHGDLKAGNVMLMGASAGGGSDCSRVWAAGGSRCLTAKVADFGLALPLGPSDTHATLMARGTPTHMSPELFMAGHVSKASDVYAYGVLLFEVITGQRAYAGVPTPLLPHEVARQGLRPTWPPNLPPGCRDLQRLAEACWAQRPQDRPTFAEILSVLDTWVAGGHGWPLGAGAGAADHSTQRQQQRKRRQQHPQQQHPQQQHHQQQQQQQQQEEEPCCLQPQPPSPQPGLGGLEPSAYQPAVLDSAFGPQPAAQQAEAQAQVPGGRAGGMRHISWSEVDCS